MLEQQQYSTTVLVVDDEPMVCELIKDILIEDEYQVDTALRGGEALRKLRERPFEVVITDIVMPEMSGLQLLKAVKEARPEAIVIVMTGYAELDYAIEALRSGAAGFLVKPFKVDDLRFTLQSALARKRTEEEVAQLRVLASLVEVGQKMVSTLDLPALAEFIVEVAARETRADRASLMLLDREGQLTIQAAVDLPPEIIATAREKLGEGIAGRVAQTGRPVVIGEGREIESWVQEAMKQTGMAFAVSLPLLAGEEESADLERLPALVSMPLLAEGESLGVLNVSRERGRGAFTPSEINWLTILSNQAAIAIQNARLYTAEQTRRQELGALYGLSRQLVATDMMETVLNTVARHAASILNVTFCRALILEAEGALVCRAAYPIRVLERDLGVGQLDPESARSHYQRVLSDGEPLVLQQDDPTLSAEERQALLLDLVPTLCLAPLKVGDELIGVLVLGEARGEAREPFDADKLRLTTAIADQAASAIHRATLHGQTEQRLQRLTALHNVDMAITASLDLGVTFRILLDQVVTQLGVDAATVLVLNPHTQTFEHAASRGFRSDSIQRFHLRLGQGLAGRAALERRIVSIPNLADADDFVRTQLLTGEAFSTYYGVPLIAKGQIKGVLEIFLRTPLDPNPDWLDFLETLAGQAAIAIDNITLFEDLQRSNLDLTLAYDTTLEGWAHALELRDMETAGHGRRVTEMTLRLARTMGMSDAELIHVRRGTLLHDIGKMGIPDSILHKPGPLSDEEWEVMHQHPVYAYELLAPIAHLRPALDIPYCHHERWDGTGYPQGLKGEHIPLAARVFAVVDAWDALNSDRPYRDAWPEEKVTEHIREQAGKQFDPQVVEAFLRLLVGAS